MFRYLFERLCALSQDILDLLEQVDAFPFNQLGYSLGQSPYQSLGDLHDSLENVYVRSDAGTRTHTVRMTIRKVRELFEEWTREVERMRAHNDRIYQQMGQCQSQEEWERLRAKLIPDDECPQPKILERVLDEHANEPDNTEVDVETTHYLDGYYSRNTNHPVQGVVVLRYDTRIYPLVCTYIHEMMHAFYDADLRNPMNDAEYAEEPLAEYGMLHFVESFVRSHPEHADMLTYAKEYVRKKQSNFGIAHYGFGAYLYEHFQHIEWEHLMRDAHSRINNTIAPYTDLKDALNGVYPSATQLPRVAQLLHDVLTDANGMGGVPIVAQAPIGGMMVGGGRIRLYSFRVAGISYPDSNGICRAHNIRSLNIGDTLTVQEDFSNPYDSEAILLIRPDGRELGFIPNDELKTIPVNIIEDGNEAHLCAIITDIQSEGAYSDRFVEVDLVIV